jgi:hypothetical protein
MNVDRRVIERVVLSSSLLFATFITITCPCEVMYSCHYWPLVVSAGIPIAYAVVINHDLSETNALNK